MNPSTMEQLRGYLCGSLPAATVTMLASCFFAGFFMPLSYISVVMPVVACMAFVMCAIAHVPTKGCRQRSRPETIGESERSLQSLRAYEA